MPAQCPVLEEPPTGAGGAVGLPAFGASDVIDHAERHATDPDVDPDRLIEVVGGAAMLHALLLDNRDFETAWADQLSAIVVHGVLR